MPRRTHTKPDTPPEVKLRQDENIITETRKYRVITPLYGGGVEPEKADPITVVRATEIRGHLRFWWRATRGGAYSTVDALRRAEEKIWGSAGGEGKAGPSRVVIRVTEWKKDRQTTTLGNRYGYVAFPLRDSHGRVQKGVEFTLEITIKPRKSDNVNELKKDVAFALWAWETFGGIGARTRRGFGALQLLQIDGRPVNPLLCNKVESDITKRLDAIAGNWPKGVPHLSSHTRFVVTTVTQSPDEAWRDLFGALKNFRQHRRKGTSPDRPGRSYWPEPEEIRHITKKRDKRHAPLSPRAKNKFPRAVFGLPIIFHFKDKYDPFDTTLQGVGYDRLASPLILRPIACADGAVGLALVLEWEPKDSGEPYTPPGGLRLQGAGIDNPVKSKLEPGEAQQIPMLKGKTDVLQAFLDYLKGK